MILVLGLAPGLVQRFAMCNNTLDVDASGDEVSENGQNQVCIYYHKTVYYEVICKSYSL